MAPGILMLPWTWLSHRHEVEKFQEKLQTINNLLQKLTNFTWRADLTNLEPPIAFALCYSTVEYACPIWESSTHARKVNTALQETSHCITGCIKSTNTDILYVIVGNEIRQAVENDKQKKQKHKMTSCLNYYSDGHPFHLTYSFTDTI